MEQYKDYFISTTLANFSYSSSEQLSDIWIKTKDSNEDNIFNGVETVPESYNDNKTGTFAFSFKKEKTLYFVFRGLESRKSWIHMNLVAESILKTVCEDAKNIETIKCIGHSLGGALAPLFAGYIGSLHPKINVLCHTFGSPRVGNKNYSR
jgi:hypothetical protein